MFFLFCRSKPPESRAKYIVFEDNLLELFEVCLKCHTRTKPNVHKNGSLVKVEQDCDLCENKRTWYSQPFVGGKPCGNLLISAAILFSGSTPSKVLRMFECANISNISMSTFLNHQKSYLVPSIGNVWLNYQKDYIQDVKAAARSVVLGGDGRADTPGHSAKFGSYSVLDLDECNVVDIQLVQVRSH